LGSITPNRTGIKTEAAGAVGKPNTMQRTANGQDWRQSGKLGFWSGQHCMPSGIATTSSAVAIRADAPVAAADGDANGATSRLAITMIESRREARDQMCTVLLSHILRVWKSRELRTMSNERFRIWYATISVETDLRLQLSLGS